MGSVSTESGQEGVLAEGQYPKSLCHGILRDVFTYLARRKQHSMASQPVSAPRCEGKPSRQGGNTTTQTAPLRTVETLSDTVDLGLTVENAGRQIASGVVEMGVQCNLSSEAMSASGGETSLARIPTRSLCSPTGGLEPSETRHHISQPSHVCPRHDVDRDVRMGTRSAVVVVGVRDVRVVVDA